MGVLFATLSKLVMGVFLITSESCWLSTKTVDNIVVKYLKSYGQACIVTLFFKKKHKKMAIYQYVIFEKWRQEFC